MNPMLKKAGLGIALAATALTAAAPAEAQYGRGYRGGYGHGGYDRGGTAVVAGIAGLAIGAAIASGNRDRYYDRGYYDRNYYDRSYAYDRGYYPRSGYYDDDYRYEYPRCYVERRYDPYYGGPVRVRVCR